MHQVARQMNLTLLTDLCGKEMQRQRRKEAFDDQYCLEIFRRAILEQEDQAWAMIQQRFSDSVRSWLYRHPSCDLALRRDSEENYISLTFSRFWYAVRDHQLNFPSLYAALSYLHATLNGILTDTARQQLASREIPLPVTDSPDEPGHTEETTEDDQTVWQSLQTYLTDPRERRLFYLLYYCGLKPREIILRCSQEFPEIKEIYRLNHNIIERLRRKQDSLRKLLNREEA